MSADGDAAMQRILERQGVADLAPDEAIKVLRARVATMLTLDPSARQLFIEQMDWIFGKMTAQIEVGDSTDDHKSMLLAQLETVRAGVMQSLSLGMVQ